ncbi:MAG: MFS transporter [Myxococcota bacterium]|nr:MFS transporter [Myxococcota bacterium]
MTRTPSRASSTTASVGVTLSGPRGPRPTSASARVALLLFAVAWGSNHFVPLLLVYRAHLGLSPVDLATLFAVYAVGLVPGLLVGGPLSDRIGRRRVVIPASCVALCGTALLAFGAEGFHVLLAGRFVVGIGSGATFSAGTAWVQDLARSRSAGTGARRASMALSSGFGGGPLLTGLIAQWAPDPMRLPYVLQGAVLGACLAAVLLLHEKPGVAPTKALPGDSDPRRALRLPPGLLRLVGPIGPWVFGFPSISFAVLPALVQARAQQGDAIERWPVAFAGVVTATTLLSGVAVQPVLKAWSPRTGAVMALALGSVGVFTGLAAVSLRSQVGLLVAAALLGTGYGGTLLSGLRIVESSTTPEDRGAATSVFYVFAYLGFAAPLLQAAAARHMGDAPGLLIAAAIAAATGLFVAKQHPSPAVCRK